MAWWCVRNRSVIENYELVASPLNIGSVGARRLELRSDHSLVTVQAYLSHLAKDPLGPATRTLRHKICHVCFGAKQRSRGGVGRGDTKAHAVPRGGSHRQSPSSAQSRALWTTTFEWAGQRPGETRVSILCNCAPVALPLTSTVRTAAGPVGFPTLPFQVPSNGSCRHANYITQTLRNV